MEKISNEELEKLLEAGITIKDKEIEAEEINLEYTEYGYFENCHFTAPKVIFNKTNYGNKIAKEEINLIFKNCSFNILWIDKVKNFKSLKFSKTSSKKAVSISHSIINDFYFKKNVKISFGILINDCTFKKFNFSKNKFVQKGYIILDGNRFNKSVTMRENDFNRLTIMNHTSLSDLSFSDNKNGSLTLISSSKFKGVKINTSNFSNFYFRDCDFFDKFFF